MLKRNPLPVFFILTFAITWAMWIPATLTRLDGGASILGPDHPIGQFGRWAPGMAALIIAAVIAGKEGVGALLRPLKIWRVNIGWYLVALSYQPLLFLFARRIDSLLGNTYDVFLPLSSVDIQAPFVFIAIGVIISALPGAFMEELGWRGFALPRLQKTNSAVVASIILGLIWGIWHISSMIFLGRTDLAGILLNVVNTIPITVLFVWIFNNTQGSLFLVTLFHASQQYSNNFLGTIPTATPGIVTWLVAIVVIFIFGMQNLSKESERIQSE